MRLFAVAFSALAVTACGVMPSAADIQQRQAETDRNNAHLQRAISSGHPIYINSKRINPPDSAGGVSVIYSLRNISTKTVKYVDLTLMPYNAVGDVVASDVGGKRKASVRFTGPLPSMEFTYPAWENIWYNKSLSCVELDSIEVTFMDGNVVQIDEARISEVFSEDFSNSCKV